MAWSGVDYLWIIVMFLSAVWTLILTAPIHCRASIAETLMQRHISPNLMKKQTHPNLGCPQRIFFKQTFIFGWTILLNLCTRKYFNLNCFFCFCFYCNYITQAFYFQYTSETHRLNEWSLSSLIFRPFCQHTPSHLLLQHDLRLPAALWPSSSDTPSTRRAAPGSSRSSPNLPAARPETDACARPSHTLSTSKIQCVCILPSVWLSEVGCASLAGKKSKVEKT